MLRIEAIALAISNINGGLNDPASRAFQLCNPLLLKSYKPERKTDDEHYRIFTTVMGGFKAGIAEILARCDGKNHRLTRENTLRDLLSLYGIQTDQAIRKVLSFVRRALQDETIHASTKLSFFIEAGKE